MRLSRELETIHASGETGSLLEGIAERVRFLEEALEKIMIWHGKFPPTGVYWDAKMTLPMPYSAVFGKTGERDYMRGVAQKALAASIKSTT